MLPTIKSDLSRHDSGGVRASSGIAVLADDLTGACDAAVAFVTATRKARVWLGPHALWLANEEVQAFNTDSRALDAEQAAALVRRAASAWAPARLVLKKIDSAGRGPIAAEVLALEKVVSPSAVILAPAFPAAGRVVRHGVLHIRDQAGTENSVVLADLFPAEALARVAIVEDLSMLRSVSLPDPRILICDAGSAEDMAALVQATREWKHCLYVGSAGLARSLAEVRGGHAASPRPPSVDRLLIVSGTSHLLTEMQLRHLPSGLAGVRVIQLQWNGEERQGLLEAFHSFSPQALLLTGGETALFVLRLLQAESIQLEGECAPGIPWGIVQGGEADGRIAITKSGGFGAVHALRDIAEGCRRKP